MGNDGIYVDDIRFLIRLRNGPVTISFEHIKQSFVLIDEDGLEKVVEDAYLVLIHPQILERLHELEGNKVHKLRKPRVAILGIFLFLSLSLNSNQNRLLCRPRSLLRMSSRCSRTADWYKGTL